MPLTPSPWHTLAPLATPLAGSESVLADDGTLNGRVLVSALTAAAQVGVTMNADTIAQSRVPNLVSDLAAKASNTAVATTVQQLINSIDARATIASVTADVATLSTAIGTKANVGDMPVNLTVSTLRLDKRSGPPDAPGTDKCILWIGQTPGAGNGDKWTLFATTGVTPFTTPIFALIYAPVFTWDPFWYGPLCADGEQIVAGGYSRELGMDALAAAFQVTIQSGGWQTTSLAVVDPSVQLEQKQAGGSWLAVSLSIPISEFGTRRIATPGADSRGLFRVSIAGPNNAEDSIAPTPAPQVSIDWGNFG